MVSITKQNKLARKFFEKQGIKLKSPKRKSRSPKRKSRSPKKSLKRKYLRKSSAMNSENQPISVTTIITNENITNLVQTYIRKQKLPPDLENKKIGDWDVSRVTNMSNMFYGCTSFNESLNDWNVSNVESMSTMFAGCTSFNQPLNAWNVGNVKNMSEMFNRCTSFNQPLNDWNVGNVEDTYSIFNRCTSFNQPLNAWNVGNVKNMSEMFADCTSFDHPLNEWNVSKVKYMYSIFNRCTSFDQPLNNWNVDNVEDMSGMFYGCTSFDQPLNDWNVSKVKYMYSMFAGCTSFDQPLNDWNVRNVVSAKNIFKNCKIKDIYKPTFTNARDYVIQNFTIQNFTIQNPTSTRRINNKSEALEIMNSTSQIPIQQESMVIPNDAKATDYINGDVDLTNTEDLEIFFKDPDNLLFFQHNVFYVVSKTQLQEFLDTNKKDIPLVFICNAEINRLNITRDLIKDNTPYLNMKSLGLWGYVTASQLKNVIEDTDTTNKVFILKDTNDIAPSVVSWDVYMQTEGYSLVSASHCNGGRGTICTLVKATIGKSDNRLLSFPGKKQFRMNKTNRTSLKRKSPKRKSPKRKSPKRKSPKRKSPKKSLN